MFFFNTDARPRMSNIPRYGYFDSTPEQPFVPIVYKPGSPDELRHNYEKPPFKKMRVIYN
jgi:hypothetical protein